MLLLGGGQIAIYYGGQSHTTVSYIASALSSCVTLDFDGKVVAVF